MKSITFRAQKRIAAAQLENLFRGIPPESRPPQTPETIGAADQVVTAWSRGNLVGLAHAAAAGRTVVLSWVFVNEAYRHRGIGRELVERLLARFPECERAKLVANRRAYDFYYGLGFRVRTSAIPMVRDLRAD